MGSADHQFNLAEILSQNYSLQEECTEPLQCPEKPEEELDKDFISQFSADTTSLLSSDMPLDELLALYGYEASDPISERESEGGESAPNLPDMTLDKEQIAKDLLSGEEEETQSSADDLAPSVTAHEASVLFPNQTRFLAGDGKEPGSSASSDTEEDALPANKCKKEIMVGPQFQADLSNLHLSRHEKRWHFCLQLRCCHKGYSKLGTSCWILAVYENEDQLLWDPNVLPEREVEEFLYRAAKRRWQEMAGSQLPQGETVIDSEQALYELVKCNFNVEEALRRLRFNVKVIRDGLCAWSEEECRNFEHGFRVHGKNFHLIQANKVRTRSVGECVEYYYLWKKSERYDYFAQQTRLGRRKYVPSGTTCVQCCCSSNVRVGQAGLPTAAWGDTDQDLEGSDPDGPTRPRPEQDTLAGVRTEPLSTDGTSRSLGEPEVGSDGLLSSEPGPCPFPQLDKPPAVTLPQPPPALADPGVYPSTAAAPEPGASPRLAVDFTLPEELPLISSHVGLSEDPEEPAAPAQVALSVTEFGLIGIGDVNPFLAGHPACPAPGLHSEPLSHCNVMTC
uniref:mesoderm induction early response protein 2 isoform X3 n=1 Tax=Ictidomys tridecemlineatus TaxID=43179 RepID=UPI001A9F6E80|nr:mesoderm induction early response protein 2 isoform X3 [Ictidomys tridecemlineatus]